VTAWTGERRFLAACRREPVDRTPVWFMRQAGQVLEGYRRIREDRSVAQIAKTPELCAEVSAMPVDVLGVDAAILFADIMLPLEPMGVSLELTAEGPMLARPLRDPADVDALAPVEPERSLAFVVEAVRLLRERLAGRAAVIGICGGPFTLACYLIEGRPSRDFMAARRFMYAEPAAFLRLMDRLADALVAYLRAQVAAGVQAIQVFDSWVGVVGPAEYDTFVAPATRRVVTAVPGTPVIHFGTGTAGLIERMAAAGGDVIGVDARQSIGEAWSRIPPDRAIQGNLDAARALAGWAAAEEGTRRVLAEVGGRPGHIFNLGHAIAPGTDEALLRRLVGFVHETSERMAEVAS
jgi:uroporphyrinogen decarboxylase